MKKTLIILFSLFGISGHSQNIFPIKTENCIVQRFCLDCGDTKASFNEKQFSKLLSQIKKKVKIEGISGSVKLQVLVDADGSGCVLSHTDGSKSTITLEIISQLNNFKHWIPAENEGVKQEKTSITMIFEIKSGEINGYIERVNLDEFKKSFDRPTSPEIFNKSYTYSNKNLDNYEIITWNSKNSNLPNNFINHIAINQQDEIWVTVDNGLVLFDGKEFTNKSDELKGDSKNISFYSLAIDNENTLWTFTKNLVHFFRDGKWTALNDKEEDLKNINKIIHNPKTGEVFFTSNKGLSVWRDKRWIKINSTTIKEMLSDRVSFAQRDSKNRLWMGTYDGSLVIDENGKTTLFENTNTVLKGKCITSMTEDENGNLYFSLFEFDRKDKKKVNNDEGIAVYYTDGTFKQFTSENSGLPFNHVTKVLYDSKEKVLWMSTDRAGLVRYDLKDSWENYHNENSNIPTSYISSMSFDSKGNLYLATRQGLVLVKRK